MSAYNLKFNKDDSVIRYIVVALLSELTHKVFYFNQVDEDTREKVEIPFFYSITGEERFLLDAFLQDQVIDSNNEVAIGVYDKVPRGIVTINSIVIDAAALVNKYIRTEVTKKIDNKLQTFSYETAIVPLILGFDIKILANNNIEMFKITESVIKTFYKNKTFQVDLGGFRVAANIRLPEDYEYNKLFEFGFTDQKLHEVNYLIEVNSFLPIFDENSKIFGGNRIEEFHLTIDDIAKVPMQGAFSNIGINPDATETDGLGPTGPPDPTVIIDDKDTSPSP